MPIWDLKLQGTYLENLCSAEYAFPFLFMVERFCQIREYTNEQQDFNTPRKAGIFGCGNINWLQAVDLDIGENAVINYYQIGRIQKTLTEGLENVQKPPFLVNRETGAVLLNFDPQKGMKGYFDFMVNI